MNIPLIDRSNYLKGLFITARLDKQINEKEKEILKKVSEKLGFAKDFFDETIRGLLTNKYLTEEPIIFSDQEIAKSFIKDALKLACADNIITDEEISWLKKTAIQNSLDDNFINEEIKAQQTTTKLRSNYEFALFSIL